MKEELIDVLDENGVLTGEMIPRSEVHKQGLWHRAIVVAIVNENNQILLQQRSEKKEIVDRPEVYQILFKYLFRF